MPTMQIDTEQLMNAVLQMPQSELEEFVRKLFTLKARENTPALNERESELLLRINTGLQPDEANRMKELIAKRQSYTITESELQELINITNEAERLNVERLKYLIELSQLRDVSLDDLMDQLGIRPAHL